MEETAEVVSEVGELAYSDEEDLVFCDMTGGNLLPSEPQERPTSALDELLGLFGENSAELEPTQQPMFAFPLLVVSEPQPAPPQTAPAGAEVTAENQSGREKTELQQENAQSTQATSEEAALTLRDSEQQGTPHENDHSLDMCDFVDFEVDLNAFDEEDDFAFQTMASLCQPPIEPSETQIDPPTTSGMTIDPASSGIGEAAVASLSDEAVALGDDEVEHNETLEKQMPRGILAHLSLSVLQAANRPMTHKEILLSIRQHPLPFPVRHNGISQSLYSCMSRRTNSEYHSWFESLPKGLVRASPSAPNVGSIADVCAHFKSKSETGGKRKRRRTKAKPTKRERGGEKSDSGDGYVSDRNEGPKRNSTLLNDVIDVLSESQGLQEDEILDQVSELRVIWDLGCVKRCLTQHLGTLFQCSEDETYSLVEPFPTELLEESRKRAKLRRYEDGESVGFDEHSPLPQSANSESEARTGAESPVAESKELAQGGMATSLRWSDPLSAALHNALVQLLQEEEAGSGKRLLTIGEVMQRLGDRRIWNFGEKSVASVLEKGCATDFVKVGRKYGLRKVLGDIDRVEKKRYSWSDHPDHGGDERKLGQSFSEEESFADEPLALVQPAKTDDRTLKRTLARPQQQQQAKKRKTPSPLAVTVTVSQRTEERPLSPPPPPPPPPPAVVGRTATSDEQAAVAHRSVAVVVAPRSGGQQATDTQGRGTLQTTPSGINYMFDVLARDLTRLEEMVVEAAAMFPLIEQGPKSADCEWRTCVGGYRLARDIDEWCSFPFGVRKSIEFRRAKQVLRHCAQHPSGPLPWSLRQLSDFLRQCGATPVVFGDMSILDEVSLTSFPAPYAKKRDLWEPIRYCMYCGSPHYPTHSFDMLEEACGRTHGMTELCSRGRACLAFVTGHKFERALRERAERLRAFVTKTPFSFTSSRLPPPSLVFNRMNPSLPPHYYRSFIPSTFSETHDVRDQLPDDHMYYQNYHPSSAAHAMLHSVFHEEASSFRKLAGVMRLKSVAQRADRVQMRTELAALVALKIFANKLMKETVQVFREQHAEGMAAFHEEIKESPSVGQRSGRYARAVIAPVHLVQAVQRHQEWDFLFEAKLVRQFLSPQENSVTGNRHQQQQLCVGKAAQTLAAHPQTTQLVAQRRAARPPNSSHQQQQQQQKGAPPQAEAFNFALGMGAAFGMFMQMMSAGMQSRMKPLNNAAPPMLGGTASSAMKQAFPAPKMAPTNAPPTVPSIPSSSPPPPPPPTLVGPPQGNIATLGHHPQSSFQHCPPKESQFGNTKETATRTMGLYPLPGGLIAPKPEEPKTETNNSKFMIGRSTNAKPKR